MGQCKFSASCILKEIMKYSIVIGTGIGNLYKSVLTELGNQVVTVDTDPTKGADFTSVDAAVEKYKRFETAHVCTPNFTHDSVTRQIAPYSEIVFVEKPGVKDANTWLQLVAAFPNTRFMMVKNNQWRDNIEQLRELASKSTMVYIDWINKDRVPNPGTWFTTKELAYGGVSRDLMPHLLSIFMALTPQYAQAELDCKFADQQWQLADLTQTDYGVVNVNGVYDVDDNCYRRFYVGDQCWELDTNWRTCAEDRRQITFIMNDGTREVIELGLCPEAAYLSMIKEALEKKDNYEFWLDQFLQDTWIHNTIQ